MNKTDLLIALLIRVVIDTHDYVDLKEHEEALQRIIEKA